MVHTQRHIAALSAHKAAPIAHLLLQIHDELLWEVSDSDLDEVTGIEILKTKPWKETVLNQFLRLFQETYFFCRCCARGHGRSNIDPSVYV